MKILAISDVEKWIGYETLVDRTRPDVVALAGDLTSDGFASFWTEALEAIPAFRRQHKLLKKQYGINGFKSLELWDEYHRELRALERKYRNTPTFRRNRKRMHVDRFYRFLKYAGKKSRVLVLKGDHDDDFEGDSSPEKIRESPGCTEITNKAVDIQGFRFLGVGPREIDSHKAVAHLNRALREIIERYSGWVDVVIAHCQFGRTPLLARLRPKLIIRGHSGSGNYLVDGVPAVFTGGRRCTLIEISLSATPKCVQYPMGPKGEVREPSQDEDEFWELLELEAYPWLKPWKPAKP